MADILIYGAINSMAGDNKAAYASQVYDEEQEEFQGEINKKVVNDCAKINGYYETMGVGTATNLKGQTVTDNEFIYRKSGGLQEVATGGAYIESIKGNTLAWNQWCDYTTNPFVPYLSSNVSASQTDLQCDATVLDFTKTGYQIGIRSKYTQNNISGHKYCLHAEIKSSISGNFACEISNIGSGSVAVTSSWTRCAFFVTVNSSAANYIIVKPQGIYYTQENNTYSVKNINVFDLTLIYGSGNEPSTPEQFEADYLRWFGKPLTYEPYDAGSLRNVQMQGLKTTGFNQWDEEWEVGQYRNDNGALYVNNYNIRCKNLISVIGGSSYYCKCPSLLRLCTYDSEKNFLGLVSGGWQNGIKTFDNNVAYISICTLSGTSSSPITTYNNDICINISDTNKNGTYEPYEGHEVSVPVTTMTGKVNGQGESVVIFPDGMKGVNDVKDEIKVENGVTKAIKRIGRVDLGTLTWTYGSSLNRFNSSVLTEIPKVLAYLLNEVNSYGYIDNATTLSAGSLDKALCFYGGRIYLINLAYTDAATFKTAMSGVYLDYELAEPIEYVVDDFVLPLNYLVNANGTEEVTMSESVTSYAAPTISIRYGMNAVGTLSGLPKAYISEESMDGFLSALGAQMGGTWTKTWNASTNKYSFTFTPSSSSS